MSESFLQQLVKTGIQETQTLLSATTSDLKKTTQALDSAVKPITEHYGNLASQMETQAARIDSQSGKARSNIRHTPPVKHSKKK